MKPNRSEKRRKTIALIFIILSLTAMTVVSILLSKEIMQLFRDPAVFRAYVEEKGWIARLIFIALMAMQIVVALIPGEPMEIAAGLAFGAVEGTFLCMAGIALGSLLVFLLVKKWGVRLLELFFPLEKIRSLKFLQNTRKTEILLFVFLVIPGTPKDLISYVAPLTDMKLGYWIALTTFARIPSVVTSTVAGNALGEKRYLFAAIVFAVSLVISVAGMIAYEKIRAAHDKKKKKETALLSSTEEKEEDHAGNP